ncbi:hypothetical protein N7490_000049 [Penicillium lividum]|nr:hypothetical protein N7490_000049 [Penicillium lividum]
MFVARNGAFAAPATISVAQIQDVRRVIGYYEGWAKNRTCDSWSPSDLAVDGLTHLNYAFATFDHNGDNWVVSPMTGVANEDEVINDLVDLKSNSPGLSIYLSIGGWSFNDGDTASYWTDMASTASGRKSWSKSVLSTLKSYGFDGVDLDWEYPVATDRGGNPDDTKNYVSLVSTLREVLDASGTSYGITFTTPASYWYLQYFDVPGLLSAGADWTNLMTYDLHGVWDGTDPWIGKIMQAHTNLTEIKSALDLMWRAGVEPSKIVLGTGFYGRSFTVDDPSCIDPGCAFSVAGNAGPCTATAGVLSYKEITEYMNTDDAIVFLDDTAAVNYMVWDAATQWVSFDTNVTFQQKIAYANEVCLGGVMIWSLDQDTYDWQALSGLLNKEVASGDLLTGGSMSDETAKDLATLYSAYNGADCYVSGCVDVNKGQCKSGYSVLEYVHSASLGMIEDPDKKLCKTGDDDSSDAQYRLICCPTEAMPESCRWEGGSDDGSCTGGGTCGKGTYELVADSYADRTGSNFCTSGKRSLCCNTDSALEKCSWTTCGNVCSSSMYTFSMETPVEGTTTNDDKLRKRDLKFHKRSSIFANTNDTFDNMIETYLIQYTNLYINGSNCNSLFESGASNTIVKMPKDLGARPYARVISLVPFGSQSTLSNIKARSTSEVYELTVDYDLASAATEEKGNINFRVDYTNLLEYWNEITDNEKSSIPLDYIKKIKLFHAHTQCPKTNIDATFDIDADISLALDGQYGYYFEGSILPTPTLISAYSYFSIAPIAAILITLRAEAVMQSDTGMVELFSAGFPGLSIKGLISISPELALTGQLAASLQVSVTLTPKVRFGISVLRGDLISGYVTAGIANTIKLGLNATASVSGDGSTSAGFCYWADFVYSIFIQVNTSDPLPLVDETCIKYTSSDPLTKRDSVEALVANSTGEAYFRGLIACNVVNDVTANGSGNITCPYVCDGTSCTILDASSSVSKRQAITSQCIHYPAMYYNCEWFPNKNIQNLDTSTSAKIAYYTSLGICSNIQNYLDKHASLWAPSYMGDTWMRLTYKPDPDNTNRDLACGESGTAGTVAANCAKIKKSLWPLAVQQAGTNAMGMPGWSDSMSCDEFPFNSAAEGGLGASNNNIRWGTDPWTGQLPRQYTVNLFDSTSNPTGTFLGTYGGYLAGNQNLYRARIAGGVNTFGSNGNYFLSATSYNALCHLDASSALRGSAMGVDYIQLIMCNVVYGDSLGTDLKKRDGGDGDDDSYTGRPEMHPRFWQVQDRTILTRRDDPEGLAQHFAQGGSDSDGLKWDDTDSVAFNLLDENDLPVSSSTFSTRAQEEEPYEGSDVEQSESALRKKHYGQHFHRHSHGHH